MSSASRAIKTVIKQVWWTILKDRDGLTNVKIISGPGKGVRLRVDVRSESAYWLGTYDRKILGQISNWVRPGQVAYDGGAFLGYYAAAMRRAVGKTGKVHVFEASNRNYQRVRHLPTANHWSNVQVHHLAVGEAHSRVRFASEMGAASGPADAPGKKLEGVAVEDMECAGIDELVYERGLPAPHFLKLDLETAECYALMNGSRLWREQRPTLLVELHRNQEERPPSFEVAERFLREFAYTGTEVHLGMPVATVEDFMDAERQGVQCTILAQPQELKR